MGKPTDEDYATLFEDMPAGAAILEELVQIYGRNPFVKGGHEADRQTAYNAGALAVINYLLARINRAHGATE